MTNREIIERIKSLYQNGVSSDDNRMSDRLIYSTIYSTRALLLKRELDRRGKLSERNLEYLECVGLAKAEPHECPCAPPTGCTILKSTCKIPRPISTVRGDYIEAVSSINGAKVFSKTSWVAKSKKKGNKYTSKTQDYFFKNDYLYITTPLVDGLSIKTVTISGIFEDISGFYCNICESCNDTTDGRCISPLDLELKMDYSLIEPLIEICVKELIEMFVIKSDDKFNNSNDDSKAKAAK